jgi:hypothetical protein
VPVLNFSALYRCQTRSPSAQPLHQQHDAAARDSNMQPTVPNTQSMLRSGPVAQHTQPAQLLYKHTHATQLLRYQDVRCRYRQSHTACCSVGLTATADPVMPTLLC